MDPTFLNRNVNEGFSGGEKKRNEILQLAVLEVSACTAAGLGLAALLDSHSARKRLAKRCYTILHHHAARAMCSCHDASLWRWLYSHTPV
jgi:Fe-S cluster assembly ATP-binding protein